MFTQPFLLVLDEATSALDGQTEANLSDAINNLKGRVTVILVAHRLSTVREADRVVYLDHGELIAEGSFETVRRNVPNFDAQAKLMGL
jgi:ABC-type multidrug transport system fused ATPase/permease subunit